MEASVRVRERSRSKALLALAGVLAAGSLSSCFLFSGFGEAIERALEVGWYLNFYHSSLWSPDDRLLVSTDEGSLAVFTLDGSEPHVLADGTISNASFSPDGSAIALGTWEGLGDYQGGRHQVGAALWVMRADGSELTPIAFSHQLTAFFPTWSPDGNWIACTIQGRIELVRPDLSERRQLSPGSVPVWSPDGRLIATMVQDEGSMDWWIQLLSLHGSPPVRLTHGSFPSWSPDGRRLTFMQRVQDEGVLFDAFVIDADGSNRGRLCDGFLPRWSPDGERILVTRLGPAKGFRLLTIAPDGSDERLLASETHWGHWSPDGRRIAFGRGAGVFVIDADGSNERSLGRLPSGRPDS